jgi:hypothetical protein
VTPADWDTLIAGVVPFLGACTALIWMYVHTHSGSAK